MTSLTKVKVLQGTLLAVLLAQHLLAYRILQGIDEGLIVWSLSDIGYYNLLLPIEDGLLFAQVALLVMWTHFGPGRWFVRWPLIAALAWALAIVASEQYLSPWIQSSNNRATQVFVCQMGLLFVGIVVMQSCGFRLRKVEVVEPPTGRFQFSLRSMFVTVLISAVAVRLGQLAYAHVLWQARLPELIAVVSVAIPLAVAPLLALWATLLPGKCWGRLLVFAVIAPALGIAGPYICGHLGEWRGFVMWTGAEAAVVGGSLLIVRACGYRIVRLKTNAVSTTAVVPPALNAAGA
jgi:hypothetical protein